MAEIKKILGQLAASATTSETLYTVPESKGAVASTLVVCNRAASAKTFRVAVSYGGAVLSSTDYLYYDVSIPANETLTVTIGLTLSNADVVRTYASSADLTFSLFGVEFDQANVYMV